jgi:hypothetical protein
MAPAISSTALGEHASRRTRTRARRLAQLRRRAGPLCEPAAELLLSARALARAVRLGS